MPIPSDYRDLLKLLNKHKVKYLLAGAYAVIYYTEPRYTKDMDIWIDSSPDNAQKVYKALKEFGAPLKGISAEDFAGKDLVYQIGIEPVRIDIIMGDPGIDFKYAWKHKKTIDFDGVKTNIIGIRELIKLKQKARRDVDNLDVKLLNLRLEKRR